MTSGGAISVDDAEGPIERMVRLVVAEVQAAGDARAERLRGAIREALAVIEAALDTIPSTSRWPAPQPAEPQRFFAISSLSSLALVLTDSSLRVRAMLMARRLMPLAAS
jgi:hypothetical protein